MKIKSIIKNTNIFVSMIKAVSRIVRDLILNGGVVL